MKKFQFSLTALEKVRKKQEDEALFAYSQTLRLLQDEHNKKKFLSEGLSRSLSRREAFGVKPVTVSAFKGEDDFIEGNKHRILLQERQIERATIRVNRALDVYLEARKRRRMVDKLREKAFTNYKIDTRKDERKKQDDVYVMNSSRKKEEVT